MISAWPAFRGRPVDGRWIVGALLVIGAGLRCWVWLGNRSLWIDEATVAVGLLAKPAFWGTHPFGQMSPPIWLGLVRAAAGLFGPTEQALRLPTLILAIAYLPAIWLLVRTVAGPRAAVVALALSAFSPALIDFAVELKPYGADPLVTVLVVAAGLRVHRAARLTVGAAAVWGALLGGLSWLSNPAILVTFGVLIAVVAKRSERAGPSADLPSRLVLAGTALGIFAIGYLGHSRPGPWLAGYLDVFWDQRFLDLRAPDFAHRFWIGLMDLVSPLFFGRSGDLVPGLLLIPIGLGFRSLRRSQPTGTVIGLVTPFALIVVLAMLRRYPLALRLDLFAAPLTTMLLSVGLIGLLDGKTRWLGRLLVLVVLLLPIRPAIALGLDPIGGRAHARPLLAEMARLREPGDVVYVLARAAPEWLFYTTDWKTPDLARIDLVEREYRFPNGRTFAGGQGRTGPVAPIGDDLRYRLWGEEEVYGQYSGFRRRSGRLERRPVDAGWAEVERDRVLRDRPGCVWLVVLHGATPELDSLRAAIEERGYQWWRELTSGSSRVVRGCRIERAATATGSIGGRHGTPGRDVDDAG